MILLARSNAQLRKRSWSCTNLKLAVLWLISYIVCTICTYVQTFWTMVMIKKHPKVRSSKASCRSTGTSKRSRLLSKSGIRKPSLMASRVGGSQRHTCLMNAVTRRHLVAIYSSNSMHMDCVNSSLVYN